MRVLYHPEHTSLCSYASPTTLLLCALLFAHIAVVHVVVLVVASWSFTKSNVNMSTALTLDLTYNHQPATK